MKAYSVLVIFVIVCCLCRVHESKNKKIKTPKKILPQKCSNKNPTLKTLWKKKLISTNEYPEKTSDKCGTEWKDYGSCCQEKSVIDYVMKEKSQVNDYLSLVLHEIRSSIDYIDISKLEYVHEMGRFNNGSLDNKLNQSNISKSEFGKNLTEYGELLTEFHTFLHQMESTFIKDQTLCAMEMNRLRSSSFCSVCSGRSDIYFMKGKAIIDQDTCTEFVSYCYDSWKILNYIIVGLDKLGYFRNRFLGGKVYFTRIFKGTLSDTMNKWLVKSGIIKIIKKSNGLRKDCDLTMEKDLCESALMLAKPTYLTNGLDSILKSTYSNLKLKEKKSKNLNEAIKMVEGIREEIKKRAEPSQKTNVKKKKNKKVKVKSIRELNIDLMKLSAEIKIYMYSKILLDMKNLEKAEEWSIKIRSSESNITNSSLSHNVTSPIQDPPKLATTQRRLKQTLAKNSDRSFSVPDEFDNLKEPLSVYNPLIPKTDNPFSRDSRPLRMEITVVPHSKFNSKNQPMSMDYPLP